MSMTHCPMCALPLTAEEARLPTCPACGQAVAGPAEAAPAPPPVASRPTVARLRYVLGGAVAGAAVTALLATAVSLLGSRAASQREPGYEPRPAVVAQAPPTAPPTAPPAADPERARVAYPPHGMAVVKGPGDDAIAARAKPNADAPQAATPAAGEGPPNPPQVVAERPAPPPPPPAMRPAPLFPQNVFGNPELRQLLLMQQMFQPAAGQDKELEQLFKMAGMQDLELAQALRVLRGGPVNLQELINNAGLPPMQMQMPQPRFVRPMPPGFAPPARTLTLTGKSVTDEALQGVQRPGDVRVLELAGTAVSGAGLERFRGLGRLDLSGTAVTDSAIARLKGLRELRDLNLADTKVTGAGLEQVKGLVQLDVSGTPFNDDGLACLKGLTQLRTVNLTGAAVTDAAVERFHQARPAVKIVR